ncbi:MAG: glycine cleavage system aminomethyltransferase GcvT [gamma proteobacterium symbiont of Bathyaustriella thionipta]|nr:glycine cleavage system aminomethyltransferase GcvT [gamma proteobacterium symbiont of Bathyaustriella thionipta]MCU7948471.1 glycine cleavage system aminomethyltransferase GcvT [gamma proteobacterium symbiont of Bathyaustriella thionipta]MCU7952467.1 glycine cleavage system aminomethyltransferase GcvT [gamma proteobacterium symbiont of Bathyaustriella thionipta]MCU7956804.1 glycine cleavage system aminomethyltransferase GcvT [gamma proteobacterium symbiont of Bathyaustriella thionipta]MCU79
MTNDTLKQASLKKTPLIKAHQNMGAKLVDFGGWNMPIHYGSQIDEHHYVRKQAGMFDVCHMTIVDLRGSEVVAYLAKLLANDVAKIADKPGKALYSCMLNNSGGVIDDLIIYSMESTWVWVVVNSATREKDIAWMRTQIGSMAVDLNERDDLAMIAVQGPDARKLAAQALGDEIAGAQELKPFNALLINAGAENERFVARTGYTGEDGYEIVCANDQAEAMWNQLADAGVKPCGLGARDTLRLEAGMNLYGNDMDENQSPLESGLSWTVDFNNEQRQFIGREALEKQKKQGLKYKFVGLILKGKGILRAHQKVMLEGAGDDTNEGELTSGSFSPTMQQAIGFARVPVETGDSCLVEIRKKQLAAQVVKLPFVRQGKILVN